MERNYATQMDAARRGIVTPELKKVAEKEYMAVEDLMPAERLPFRPISCTPASTRRASARCCARKSM